jgi:hypothetical protein
LPHPGQPTAEPFAEPTAEPFAELYAQCAQRVAQLVYLVVRDEQIAARAVHDAFALAGSEWESAGTTFPSAEGWVRAEALRIATGPKAKVALAYRRLRIRLGGGAGPAGPATPVDADARLLDILAELPTVQVTAFVLYHLAGLEVDDIAFEMESSVAAAATRIHAAESAVARALELMGSPDEVVGPRQIREQLQGWAERAELSLLPVTSAHRLPERRTRRAVALTGAAAGSILVVLALANALGQGDGAPLAPAVATAAPSPAAGPVSPARTATAAPPARSTPTASPWSFLDMSDTAPDVAAIPASGRDFGYVRSAFRHDGQIYVEFDRAQLRSGRISNNSSQLRIFPVATNALVEPGRRLLESFPTGKVSLRDFLRLVVSGAGSDVPVSLRYDSGEIETIAEPS